LKDFASQNFPPKKSDFDVTRIARVARHSRAHRARSASALATEAN